MSFSPIFCPLTLLTTQKIKILKMKKTPGDIILHLCSTNDNHKMYGSWDMECDSKLRHIRHAIACTRLCTRLKCWRHAKKACLVCLKKLQGVRQITRLKQHFLSFVFYITQKSYKKIMCIVIWLVQWWKLHYIYISFTQRTTHFDRLRRNMSDGTIVFLTSLLIALTWNILLLFSFWQKIISYFE